MNRWTRFVGNMKWESVLAFAVNFGIGVGFAVVGKYALATYAILLSVMFLIIELQRQFIEETLKDMKQVLKFSRDLIDFVKTEEAHARQESASVAESGSTANRAGTIG